MSIKLEVGKYYKTRDGKYTIKGTGMIKPTKDAPFNFRGECVATCDICFSIGQTWVGDVWGFYVPWYGEHNFDLVSIYNDFNPENLIL